MIRLPSTESQGNLPLFLIAESARRHGVADDDMVHAATYAIRGHDLGDGFSMLVGPGHDAQLLEVGVVSSVAGHRIVHAMPARTQFLSATRRETHRFRDLSKTS